MLHLEILDEDRVKLLGEISKIVKEFHFYMAGGTALSLQRGYRTSVDYPYKALEMVSGAPEYPDLLMASVKDIACMKMTAIAQRGAKKDFYDLYEILQEEKYSPDDLLDMLREKFGADENILNTMIMGLSYFDDAEKQQMKKVFMKADWAVIKRASIRLAEELEACCLLKYREDENAPTGRQGI